MTDIDPKDPYVLQAFFVEIGYRCPGQFFDEEFEGLLEFDANTRQVGAAFRDGRRWIKFHFDDPEDAKSFAKSALKYRPDTISAYGDWDELAGELSRTTIHQSPNPPS